MIKLTLQIGAQQSEKVFNKDSVLLGAGSADLIGLPFDTSSLRTEHIRIFEKEGVFFVQNIANDPFVTLNGRPFGKKKIASGDRLAVAEAEITFEGNSETTSSGQPLESVQDALSNAIKKKTSLSTSQLSSGDDVDVEALIREVEGFDKEPKAKQTNPVKGNSFKRPLVSMPIQPRNETSSEPVTKTQRHWTPRSLNERQSGRIRRAAFNENTFDSGMSSAEVSRRAFWRPFLAILIVLFAILAATGSGIYFTFNEKSDEQEFIAAQGLADMSMALTYAQIHQIKPPNQNWGDPDFLQEALGNVLPAHYPSLISVDKQGSFTNCPYMLRVYTSGDLSQFLLLAQPAPSLWQWLLSRETILLDSRTMELHKTTDLRSLNRLLANPKPLEGSNALEVSHLVNQASLIRLTTLATDTEHREFLPPKGLNKIRPGAETRVYNAPRYYQFSTPLTEGMAQIVNPGPTPLSEEKIQELQKNVTDMAKLSHFVFYSSLEQSTTHKVIKLMQTWIPNEPITFAQLTLEHDGRVVSAVALEKEVPEAAKDTPPVTLPTVVEAEFKNNETPVEPAKETVPIESIEQPTSLVASLNVSLKAIAEHRQQVLLPFKQQLLQLVDEHINTPNPDLVVVANRILQELEDVDLGQQVDIRHAIVDAYRVNVMEDKLLSHDEFIIQVQKAGLGAFLPVEFLQTQPPPPVAQEDPPGDRPNAFAAHLQEIQQAPDLAALEAAVAGANKALAEEPALTGSERLRTLHNKLQVNVLHRLEQLILGATTPLTASAFNPHNRVRVQNILLTAGVEDPEQRDYYLHEFDLLIRQKTPSEEE